MPISDAVGGDGAQLTSRRNRHAGIHEEPCKRKFDRVADAAVEALVRWDPKSASEAELRSMEQQLNALGREVALAQQGYEAPP